MEFTPSLSELFNFFISNNIFTEYEKVLIQNIDFKVLYLYLYNDRIKVDEIDDITLQIKNYNSNNVKYKIDEYYYIGGQYRIKIIEPITQEILYKVDELNKNRLPPYNNQEYKSVLYSDMKYNKLKDILNVYNEIMTHRKYKPPDLDDNSYTIINNKLNNNNSSGYYEAKNNFEDSALNNIICNIKDIDIEIE